MKNLLMIGGDTTILRGQRGPFWYTLEFLAKYWGRIDVLCNAIIDPIITSDQPIHGNVYLHPNTSSRLGYSAWAVNKVAQLHKEYNYSVATCHLYPPFLQLRASLAIQKKLGIPVVGEWHGVSTWQQASSAVDYIGSTVTQLYGIKRSAQLQGLRTVSSTVQNYLVHQRVPATLLTLLPAVYINTQIWKPSEVESTYSVAFCGRIDANKRLDRVVRALAQLPGCTLVVIGDGPELDTIKQLAKKLGVYTQITWCGWLQTPQQVAAVVQSARCLVMPSGYEGGPRVVVESLAAGVPVVATNVGIVPDVLVNGTNGLITDGSVAGIASCVSQIIADAHFKHSAVAMAPAIAQTYERTALLTAYNDWLARHASVQ